MAEQADPPVHKPELQGVRVEPIGADAGNKGGVYLITRGGGYVYLSTS